MRFHRTKLDCSHFVHALYDRVGLTYHYGTSRSLYGGTRIFRRVIEPEPGDLVAWRGHIGIVVNPVRHSFLSALRSGVKVSSYESRYWKLRGHPRFLHYVARGDFGQNQNSGVDYDDAETMR
jgi:cell wall-associated NlpC family hydrolase